VAWAEVYFRTKWRLHPSSSLATVEMGQKLGEACAFFSGELGPYRTQSRLGRGLPPYKWHLSPPSRFTTTDIGGRVPLGKAELGPHLTQSRLG